MDLNKDNSKEKTRRLSGNRLPPLEFGDASQAEQGVGKVYSEKREGFKYARVGHCCNEEAGGRLTRSGASHLCT